MSELPDSVTTPATASVFVTSHSAFPGSDAAEIHRLVRGELGEPNLAVMPELPDRGIGADPIGRSAALIEGLGFDLQPHGWRIGVPDGIDARKARSLLRSDENLLADVIGAEKAVSGRLKITVQGPWSLAASLYLSNGERAISDYGARRDISESYAHGVHQLLQRVRRNTGISDFTVQLEEPLLAGVLDGTLPTASGYRTLRSIPRHEVRQALEDFAHAVAGEDTVAWAVNIPEEDPKWRDRVDLLHQAGFDGLIVNPEKLDYTRWERIAALVETDAKLFLEALTPGQRAPGVVQGVHNILRPWRTLGLPLQRLGQLRLMPRTSFADTSADEAASCLQSLTGYAQALEQTRVDA